MFGKWNSPLCVWLISKVNINIFTSNVYYNPGTKSGKPHWTLPDKEKHKHCKDEVPEPSRDKEHSHGHDDQHGHGANVKGNYMYDVMEATMLPHENELVTAFDLKEYKTAVDIGGQYQCSYCNITIAQ
jgi:hypothetical protein